jgi:cysteine desulfurase / selenocysteine lyase
MIYLDHAATSYPKPQAVLDAMRGYLESAGNPGRSSHRMGRRAEEYLWGARQAIAGVLGAAEPDRVVFTLNATMALNMALQGILSPGARVLTSSFEHNSVARPLHAMARDGIAWQPVPAAADSPVDLDVLESELAAGDVRAICMAHASNVTGAVLPVAQVHSLARQYGAVFVLDAAQSAGHLPVSADLADIVVFAGHKGLWGPQGTGGMYVGDGVAIRPTIHGGTGGRSDLLTQPRWLPHALEAGTANGVGIAGLAAGARYVTDIGIGTIRSAEITLRQRLVDGLRRIPGIVLHESATTEAQVGVVSVSQADRQGQPVLSVAALLDERFGICVRAGLHCAPLAHRAIGTMPDGTVRFSVSHQTTVEEVDTAVTALADVVAGSDRRRGSPAQPSYATRERR